MRTLRTTAAGAAALTLALAMAACSGSIGGDDEGGGSGGGDTTLTIGFVSTDTGALAPFGEANAFVVDQMNAFFADNPLEVGGEDWDVEIISKDAQSDSTRAGEVAADLINSDGVDVIVSSGTPDI